MLKSESSRSKLKLRVRFAAILVLCATATFVAAPSLASAQAANFTLQAAPFSPDAVAPGGTSSSNITVGTEPGFTGTVSLSCQVTTTATNITSPPACAVSPATVTPPGGATATITTTDSTTTVGYSVTITGTGPSTTITTTPLALTVLAVTPQFTISVQNTVQPQKVPAGSGAQGIIIVNPINGYISPPDPNDPKGGVTLSCASIAPLVTIPPYCSFNPQSVKVDGTSATSTITITTQGPQITGTVAHPRAFYALWLPMPMLVMVGLGAAVGGKKSRKAWGLLALFVISGALFLMPACANTSPNVTDYNGTTPANTYNFTVVGVDANGIISSNTTSTTSTNPTVSLTVTAPTL